MSQCSYHFDTSTLTTFILLKVEEPSFLSVNLNDYSRKEPPLYSYMSGNTLYFVFAHSIWCTGTLGRLFSKFIRNEKTYCKWIWWLTTGEFLCYIFFLDFYLQYALVLLKPIVVLTPNCCTDMGSFCCLHFGPAQQCVCQCLEICPDNGIGTHAFPGRLWTSP